MKIAVVYARFSCDRQNEQSIDGQLRVCEKYAKEHDIIIVNNYIDRAMTGTNDNRAEFQQMLKDSDKKEWDYVLVYKLDRFSRNKYEMTIHKKRLKDNGIKLLSAMEQIPDAPEGVLLESLLEGMNQYYSEELSQKTKRGMNETRLKGHFIGGIPNYGWSVVDIMQEVNGKMTKVAAKLIINEEEAAVVREIFTAYSNGATVANIIRSLNSRGITNRGKPFIAQTVYVMLRHEKYTGIYRVNGEVFDKVYPQIVPIDVFELVKKRIDANKYGKHVPDLSYLLRGLVYCGICGTRVVSHSGTSKSKVIWRYYKCHKIWKGCSNKQIRKELLENLVLKSLNELFCTDNNIQQLVEYIYNVHVNRVENNTNIKMYESELIKVNKALKNIIAAVEAGIFTDTTKSRLQELEKQKKELETQIVTAKNSSCITLTKEKIYKHITTALQRNEQCLIDMLVKRVNLFPDKIEILLKYDTKPIDRDGHYGRKNKNHKKDNPTCGSFYISYTYNYQSIMDYKPFTKVNISPDTLWTVNIFI